MEILFRGKSGGEWVTGSLIQLTGKTEIVKESSYEVSLHTVVEVAPETVGQFAGLLDKNGKRIFEGDKVKCFDYEKSDWYSGTIIFDGGAFCVEIKKCLTPDFDLRDSGGNPSYDNGQTPAMFDFERLEIIGNIHDL